MTVGPPARRGVFAAEIVVLVATTVVDSVLTLRTDDADLDGGHRVVATVLDTVVPYVGTAVAVLAVLRRRFPTRIGLLACAVIGFSLLSTTVSAASGGVAAHPVATEVVAAVLLVGAGCRRLPPVRAAALAAGAGAAVVLAPIVRYGADSPMALLAAPAALLWGTALAIGLILRDADARHRAALDRVRTNDRLQVARELHDLVAHHVSGIVVRVRAAQALSGNPAAPPQDPDEVYGEIEEAAAEALGAMRELVGMLRGDEHVLPPPDASVGEVVRTAADGATVDVADELDGMAAPPELAAGLDRVVREALTNVRRHAPHATEVRVSARLDGNDLVLEVDNDGVTGERSTDGYGIIGMTERVAALGGTLEAGPRRDGRWLVAARLPVGEEDTAFAHLRRGV